MVVVHVVSSHFPPARGGLEAWTHRLVRNLSRRGFSVVVYIRDGAEQHDYDGVARADGIEIRLLGPNRICWEEPLVASASSPPLVLGERWRLDSLALRNAVVREVAKTPSATHVLASSYITQEGFLTSTVAEELELPHVAFVVGTDFSRGIRNPPERAVIAQVVRAAAWVVTLSTEQERGLRRSFGISNVVTVHASIDEPTNACSWRSSDSGSVVLFCDGGYSYKKGTQVLMNAFSRLHDEGLPVRLVICGTTYEGHEPYWAGLRAAYRERYPLAVRFDDYLDRLTLSEIMSRCDLYCSPTLGEGCSHARVAALCAGMPIVTTRCGEMPDVADGAAHVRMSLPGDAEGFVDELRDACRAVLAGTIHVDRDRVAGWREYFAPARESLEIEQVIRRAAGR